MCASRRGEGEGLKAVRNTRDEKEENLKRREKGERERKRENKNSVRNDLLSCAFILHGPCLLIESHGYAHYVLTIWASCT